MLKCFQLPFSIYFDYQYCNLYAHHSQFPLNSWRISSFRPGSASALSRLFTVLNVIAKRRVQTSYSVLSGDSAMSYPNGDARVHPVPQRTYQVVVAATHKMGIGKDGKLPWNLPSDLKFFKELTMTTSDPGKKNAVVMGRKTWESIPLNYRPLPGRLNVVLTRSGSFDNATVENVVICGSMPSALKLLAESPYCLSIDKVFVIGGGQILRWVIYCSLNEVETVLLIIMILVILYTGKHWMLLVVMPSTSLKLRQALNVTLSFPLLTLLFFIHGIHQYHCWKTTFYILLWLMFVWGVLPWNLLLWAVGWILMVVLFQISSRYRVLPSCRRWFLRDMMSLCI